MKNLGRPKLDEAERKEVRFSIRLNTQMKSDLDNYCNRNHIATTEAIRSSIALLLSKETEKET